MKQLQLKFKTEGITSTVSKEEGYFYDWLLELKARGYIHEIEIQPNYLLTKALSFDFLRPKVSATKGVKLCPVSYTSLHDMCYAPDFNVWWNLNAIGKFVFLENDILAGNFQETLKSKFFGTKTNLVDTEDGNTKEVVLTVLEVKGTFASRQNSTAIKFPLLQKLMYAVHKVYVNKVMPLDPTNGIFKHTFTPASYVLTEKTQVSRKINWTVKNISTYITEVELTCAQANVINSVLSVDKFTQLPSLYHQEQDNEST